MTTVSMPSLTYLDSVPPRPDCCFGPHFLSPASLPLSTERKGNAHGGGSVRAGP